MCCGHVLGLAFLLVAAKAKGIRNQCRRAVVRRLRLESPRRPVPSPPWLAKLHKRVRVRAVALGCFSSLYKVMAVLMCTTQGL